jgi:hypothetical protein
MFTHHPSMAPGAIIGYRKSGIPIRLIAGASEGAPEPPAGDPPPADPANPPAPAAAQGDPAAPVTGQEPPAAPAEPTSVEQLPAWAQKLIRDGRNEAAANRTKAKEHETALAALQAKSQQQLDGIAKALGLKPEEATPEQIMAERDAARAASDASAARAREAAVELAVFRAAAHAQVNGNALLDSRSFVATLTGLDPAADDFAQRVNDAITAAVEANPGWKVAAPAAPVPVPPAAPAVPKSGTGPVTGVPDGPRQWTEADVQSASPSEVQAAMDAGLLQNLGFGTARKNRR